MSSNIYFHQQGQQATIALEARVRALESMSPLLEERVRFLEGQVAKSDARIAALDAVPLPPAAYVANEKSRLAQNLLTAVQTDNVDEISRLVAAGISLRNLPGNSVTQRRLLSAVSPRLFAGPPNAKTASAAAREAYAAAVRASRSGPKSQSAGPLLAAHRALFAAEKQAVLYSRAAPKTGLVAMAATAARAAPVPFAAAPAAVEGELQLINGRLYMIRNGNVYEYDQIGEKAGAFVGRLTAHETIDTSAAEVGGAANVVVVRHLPPPSLRVAIPPSAPVAAPAAVNSGDLQLIDGTLYKVKNGNVYEFDELTESVGDFVGRLTAHHSIDTSAAEVASGGSRKTRGRKNKRRSTRRNRG